MNKDQSERISPFACVMDAIEPDKRQQHIATARRLFHSIKEVRELPDGYAFRLSDEPEMLLEVAGFIALEKLCCPFFGFTVRVEPEGGNLWLELTGREGVKPFIRAEIGEFMGESSAFPVASLQ
jgi:hypothetical protein